MQEQEILANLLKVLPNAGPEIQKAFLSLTILPKYKFALSAYVEGDTKFLPTKAEPEASGYDVRAAPIDKRDIVLRPGQYFKIPLGFKSFCPPGWYLQLHPRSSSFMKKYMHTLIGVIDETFPLSIALVGQYIPDVSSLANDLVIKYGDPIGQVIPTRRENMDREIISNDEYDELCKKRNAVRTGGFGSTHL